MYSLKHSYQNHRCPRHIFRFVHTLLFPFSCSPTLLIELIFSKNSINFTSFLSPNFTTRKFYSWTIYISDIFFLADRAMIYNVISITNLPEVWNPVSTAWIDILAVQPNCKINKGIKKEIYLKVIYYLYFNDIGLHMYYSFIHVCIWYTGDKNKNG